MLSTTPEGLQIRPRHMDFALPTPLPRHWNGGDAFKSHLFDAMSVLFPDGERFFIDSVRHFREQIDDPVLQEQIRGFIGQEGHHSREHQTYSNRLRDLGYDVDALEKRAKRRIRYTQKKFSPQRQLAATAALEHITAIMADGLLKDSRHLAGAHPTMVRLWRWHALEETEHKAVAFDVYNRVCGNRRLLRRAMVMA
ncbi:metal-dependent hydrolase, partial [Pseudomonas sp. CrR25]|nr:metal-dependent hydrolase [Pseudomonas sp. CrR25]